MLLEGVCYLQVVVSLAPGVVEVEEVNSQPLTPILDITATLGWALPPS
jgi:hypothetical protein